MSAVSMVTPTAPVAGLPAMLRLLGELLPDAQAIDAQAEASLEMSAMAPPPARLISATIIEGGELRARRVFEPPSVGLAAFLDGTQQSRIVFYTRMGAPIVQATVAAVVRDRRNQRLYTCDHVVWRRYYAPRACMADAHWRAITDAGFTLVDTTDVAAEEPVSDHPLALREAAIHRVQKDRELAEQSLAERWCRRPSGPLLIDGGISGTETVARSTCAIGVIKSHRTLYAMGDALAVVFGLGLAERSSVFLVTSPKRAPVASWYLRIRDRQGHDPMWGLVRVEVAVPDARADAEVAERADEVSRWILAEVTPLSLPDSRWDKMVYGVRDCEEFLRAVM